MQDLYLLGDNPGHRRMTGMSAAGHDGERFDSRRGGRRMPFPLWELSFIVDLDLLGLAQELARASGNEG
jgi:hypothetical protein